MTALGFQKLLWVWIHSSRLNVVLAGVVGRGATDVDNEVASSSDNLRDIDDRRENEGERAPAEIRDKRTPSDRRAVAPARQRTAQVVPPIARR